MSNLRIGTRTNLENGGTYDLLILGFPNGFPRGYISFELGDTPRRVTGVQKVVQTFLYILLGGRGSDPIRPTSGTNFASYIYSANLGNNQEELRTLLRAYIRDAEAQTKKVLGSRAQDTASQLKSVEILFLTSADESINLGLKVTTVAGATASVAIPFPQIDLAINAS